MITREVICAKDNFARAQAFTTTPAGEFGWTIKDTSSAGTPTYLCLTDDGGAAKLLCDNTSEAQIITLYQNNVLPYDLALLQYVDFVAKVGGIDSVTTLVFGVCTAQHDTSDSTDVHAWFRMEGSASTTAVVLETDDATTDYNDKATGVSLSTTYKKFTIDFTNGLSDIRFFIDGARVGQAVTHTLASITAGQNVQLYCQLQKASGTGVPYVQFSQISVQYKTADGA